MSQSNHFLRHSLPLQLFIALPFISTPQNFSTYLSGAFDLSRVFLYKWTVNWRFLTEERFLSPQFSKSLLIGHLSFLVFFGLTRWTGLSKRGSIWIRERWIGNEFQKSKVGIDDEESVTVREPTGKCEFWGMIRENIGYWIHDNVEFLKGWQ